MGARAGRQAAWVLAGMPWRPAQAGTWGSVRRRRAGPGSSAGLRDAAPRDDPAPRRNVSIDTKGGCSGARPGAASGDDDGNADRSVAGDLVPLVIRRSWRSQDAVIGDAAGRSAPRTIVLPEPDDATDDQCDDDEASDDLDQYTHLPGSPCGRGVAVSANLAPVALRFKRRMGCDQCAAYFFSPAVTLRARRFWGGAVGQTTCGDNAHGGL